jgi:hypothetical protein
VIRETGERRERRVTPVPKALQVSRETREPMVRMASMEQLGPLDPLDLWDPADRRVIRDLPETLLQFQRTLHLIILRLVVGTSIRWEVEMFSSSN